MRGFACKEAGWAAKARTMTDDGFTWREWSAPDGLTLRYRDYEGSSDRAPVICLHGLTRNSRDFADLAEHLSSDRRVIVPDMRGRGKSDYGPDPANYNVPTYVDDLIALREQSGITRYVAIGTSMGGLMTLAQAAKDAEPIIASVLNDIGPEVAPAGLDKIKTYVGQGRNFPTWVHAARALQDVHSPSHPAFELEDWIAMAKRTMTMCSNGRIAFDYDLKIAEPILDAPDDVSAVPPDLWPGFERLAAKPMLLIRGELSDLLTTETFAEMKRRAPEAQIIEVPETGHAPTLTEPEAMAAIDAFLRRV